MKPSFEEFEELVRLHFSQIMPSLLPNQIEAFLESEDAQDAIKEEFHYSEKRFENGELSSSMFKTGSVSAAVSCLYMLY